MNRTMSGESSRMLPVKIMEADLKRTDHQRAIVELIDAYAMGSYGKW